MAAVKSKEQLLAISYSKAAAFIECPLRCWYVYREKLIPFTGNQYTEEGTAAHKDLENYCRDGTPLTRLEYKSAADKIKNLDAGIKLYEVDMAINDKLEPVEYFAKDVWVRGGLDVLMIRGNKGFIGDWKTNKKKSDMKLELRIFTLLAFQKYPQLESITTTFIWLKLNEMTSVVYTRADLPDIVAELKSIYQQMDDSYVSGAWTPKPARYKCGWCAANEICSFKE